MALAYFPLAQGRCAPPRGNFPATLCGASTSFMDAQHLGLLQNLDLQRRNKNVNVTKSNDKIFNVVVTLLSKTVLFVNVNVSHCFFNHFFSYFCLTLVFSQYFSILCWVALAAPRALPHTLTRPSTSYRQT